MRALAIGAFVLDGAAAIGFVATMALGEGRMTPLDAFILSALLLGFFSAFGSVMLTGAPPADETANLILAGAAMFDRLPADAKRDLRQHFPPVPPVEGYEADPAQDVALCAEPSLDAILASSRVR